MFFTVSYFLLIFLTIGQRIFELFLSHKNEVFLKKNGAYEIGQNHFFYMKLIHIFFFISLLTEWACNHFQFSLPQIPLFTRPFFISFFFILFLSGQILRIITQKTLKKRWTAKILIYPQHPPIKSGIYQWLNHPNYIGVCLEIFSLPLIMGLWKTGILFTMLNAIILYFRIRAENEALKLMN